MVFNIPLHLGVKGYIIFMNLDMRFFSRQYGSTTSLKSEILKKSASGKTILIVLNKLGCEQYYGELIGVDGIEFASGKIIDNKTKARRFDCIYFDNVNIKLTDGLLTTLCSSAKEVVMVHSGIIDTFIYNYVYSLMNNIPVTIHRKEITYIGHAKPNKFTPTQEAENEFDLLYMVNNNVLTDATRDIVLRFILKQINTSNDFLLDKNLLISKK